MPKEKRTAPKGWQDKRDKEHSGSERIKLHQFLQDHVYWKEYTWEQKHRTGAQDCPEMLKQLR